MNIYLHYLCVFILYIASNIAYAVFYKCTDVVLFNNYFKTLSAAGPYVDGNI